MSDALAARRGAESEDFFVRARRAVAPTFLCDAASAVAALNLELSASTRALPAAAFRARRHAIDKQRTNFVHTNRLIDEVRAAIDKVRELCPYNYAQNPFRNPLLYACSLIDDCKPNTENSRPRARAR